MSVSDNICLANAWMGSISVSGVTLSHCHTAGAHKTLDTQADHCPHNNSDSLLLTARSSKQTNNYTTLELWSWWRIEIQHTAIILWWKLMGKKVLFTLKSRESILFGIVYCLIS